MKFEWAYFSVSLLVNAFRSTLGGIITLLISLAIATCLGLYTLSGYWIFSGESKEIIIVLFIFLYPLVIACLRVWGLLQVALIIWAVWKLTFDDASRMHIAMLMIFPQYLCTVIAIGLFEGPDSGFLIRFLIITPLTAIVTAVPFFVQKLINRKKPTQVEFTG